MQISLKLKTYIEQMVSRAAQTYNINLEIQNETLTSETYNSFFAKALSQDLRNTAILACCEDRNIRSLLNDSKIYSHILFYNGFIAPLIAGVSEEAVENMFAGKLLVCSKCEEVSLFAPCACGDEQCTECYSASKRKRRNECILCEARYHATKKLPKRIIR